ncbi:hypothetical protein QEZ54_35360 [Catellatospora sp. KI3]|uniref:hypothetical protein n=1 Tax=Catellatospora sp. KI3 TaxID=3041620 RepID=UPI002482225B|nr:hypothetical protein [Catellatospora sp. KI3]MDI1466269.1 hypothetical protein [Catellatospora sp. KI3]
MNKWFYRAVGAVGVASGVMLLGSGVAHAETATEAKPTADLQAMRGLVADLLSPTAGLGDLGLSLDTPQARVDAGLLPDGPVSITHGNGSLGLTAHAPGVQDITLASKLPRLSDMVPSTNLLSSATGLLGQAGDGSAARAEGSPLGPLSGLLGGGGTSPVAGLTGGLTGGLFGGASPIGGLTDGPLGGLTGGLLRGGTDGGGPLGGLTGMLDSGGGADSGPLGGLTGGLTDGLGGITGGVGSASQDRALDRALTPRPTVPAADDTTQDPFGDWLDTPAAGLARQGDMLFPGDVLDPTDQQGLTLDPVLSRQVADATSQIVPDLIADAMGRKADGDLFGAGPDLFAPGGQPDLLTGGPTEGIPFVDGIPLLGDLIGNGGPLDGIIAMGDIAKQLPVVRDVVTGKVTLDTVNQVPVVGNLLRNGVVQGGKPGTGLPLIGSLPIVGDAISKATSSLNGFGMGRGANMLAPQPQVAQPQPGLAPAPAPQPQPQLLPAPQAAAPVHQHEGRHRATDRPVVGEEAEYAESARTPEELPLVGQLPLSGLPLLGSLTGGAGSGGAALPVGGLFSQLPLVNDLPLLGDMPTSMEVLRALPVVGTAASLLPLG